MEILFYGEPNSLVRITKRKPLSRDITSEPLFRFNADGEYLFEGDDMNVINRLKAKFAFKEIEIETADAPVECESVEASNDAKLRHCKKCDFTCDNQGDLMRHYREQHKN